MRSKNDLNIKLLTTVYKVILYIVLVETMLDCARIRAQHVKNNQTACRLFIVMHKCITYLTRQALKKNEISCATLQLSYFIAACRHLPAQKCAITY